MVGIYLAEETPSHVILLKFDELLEVAPVNVLFVAFLQLLHDLVIDIHQLLVISQKKSQYFLALRTYT
jgi:hypothetical protein